MAKTLAEYISYRPAPTPRSRTYTLEDSFEQDPHQYCPGCNSTKIERFGSHNSDGVDYRCLRCSLQYELRYSPD